MSYYIDGPNTEYFRPGAFIIANEDITSGISALTLEDAYRKWGYRDYIIIPKDLVCEITSVTRTSATSLFGNHSHIERFEVDAMIDGKMRSIRLMGNLFAFFRNAAIEFTRDDKQAQEESRPPKVYTHNVQNIKVILSKEQEDYPQTYSEQELEDLENYATWFNHPTAGLKY